MEHISGLEIQKGRGRGARERGVMGVAGSQWRERLGGIRDGLGNEAEQDISMVTHVRVHAAQRTAQRMAQYTAIHRMDPKSFPYRVYYTST